MNESINEWMNKNKINVFLNKINKKEKNYSNGKYVHNKQIKN